MPRWAASSTIIGPIVCIKWAMDNSSPAWQEQIPSFLALYVRLYVRCILYLGN